jgi:hypothetical protein
MAKLHARQRRLVRQEVSVGARVRLSPGMKGGPGGFAAFSFSNTNQACAPQGLSSASNPRAYFAHPCPVSCLQASAAELF